jgi:hypothetical protein
MKAGGPVTPEPETAAETPPPTFARWRADYRTVRLVFQRGLALVYLVAYLVTANQFRGLLGEHGLLPAPLFIQRAPFREVPSLFFVWHTDTAFMLFAWLGVAVSAAALVGITERFGWVVSAASWAFLWSVYLSFINIGQTFYGFGWEMMLVEAGFLAIFLGPCRAMPSPTMIWLLRWMQFRVMLGAGLIKLRGDPCWRQLTCLDEFYESQPMPNPLSWHFHHLPRSVLHSGVLFNHFVELIVPFVYFLPQPFAGIAGLVTIVFQLLLMLGGNLSFLNFFTIVLAVPLLEGRWLERWLRIRPVEVRPANVARPYVMAALAVTIAIMSIPVVSNMASSQQVMNMSYNPLQLVNTYGMFGSITPSRDEVVVEGSDDGEHWLEYEFKGKPGDVMRAPPQIAPYHLRLDWLMWFAAMGRFSQSPWFVNFTAKLLKDDHEVLSLIRTNPFHGHAPKFIRAKIYHYRFTTPEEHRQNGAWWHREEAGQWFPTVSLDMPEFQRVLEEQGWN